MFRNGDGGIGVTDIDFAGDEHDGDVRDGGNADFVGGWIGEVTMMVISVVCLEMVMVVLVLQI